MSTALVKSETTTALTEWTDERMDLLKRTVAIGATNDEFALFVAQCKRTGLDPFSRQIHFIKRSGKLTIQTGIDGYRLIADRTGKYAGNDEPVFVGDEPLKGGKTHPTKAIVTVWKIVDGVRCPFVGMARWDEYYPGDGGEGFMWRKMPFGQLAKCAESLALRKAFPQELSGIYTHDEMEQAGSSDNDPPARPTEQPRHQAPPATKPANGHAEAPARQLPRNGVELYQRLKALEDGLVAEKKCKPAALLTHVREAGMNQGYSDDLSRWDEPEQIAFAVDAVKAFLAQPAQPAAPTPDGLALHNWCRDRGKELHAQAGCTNEDDLLKWMAEHGRLKGWGHDMTKWHGKQLADGETEAERWLAEQWERVRAQGEPVEGEIVPA